jgi:metacaspase-1
LVRSKYIAIFSVIILSILSISVKAAAQKQHVTGRKPRKIALLVGIGEYFNPDIKYPWGDLLADQDALNLKTLLSSPQFGFEVKTLINKEATKNNIITAFEEYLINQAKPGDIVVFYFSGHGQQVRSKSHVEIDGMDESLVPYDYIDDSAVNREARLTDKEINVLLTRLKDKMQGEGEILVLIDSCHSGTITRTTGNLSRKGRPWDVERDGEKPRGNPTGILTTLGSNDQGNTEELGYILISASRAHESAYQCNDELKMGILTHYFIKNLRHSTTYRELYDKLRMQVPLRAHPGIQNPTMEGNLNRKIFRGEIGEPQSYVLVEGIDEGGFVILETGTLLGSTKGSIFEIYRNASDKESRIAEVELVELGNFRSCAKIVNSYQKIDPDKFSSAQAVLTKHNYGEDRLRVYFGNASHIKGIVNDIEIITWNSVSQADCDIFLVFDKKSGKLEIRESDERVLRYVKSGSNGKFDRQELFEVFRSLYRRKLIMNIGQEDPSMGYRFEAEIEPCEIIFVVENGRKKIKELRPKKSSPLSNHYVFETGDALRFHIRNRSGKHLFINSFLISGDGTVTGVYPRQTGFEHVEGSRVPPDKHKWWLIPRFELLPTEPGQYILKFIATEQAVVLTNLADKIKPARASSLAQYDPLANLIRESLDGGRTRSTINFNPNERNLFGTYEIRFEIKSKE